LPSRAPKRQTRVEKRAETRRRLLAAAATVFIRRGFQGASVEEICEEAGFTRGAFYSNFESKEQMFVELVQDRVYDEFRTMAEQVPTDVSPADQIRWAAEELKKGYERPAREWLFALWLECLVHAARNPGFRSLAATFWSGTREMNANVIREAYEELGKDPPVEPKHLATAFTALDIGLAVQHLVDPEAVPLELYPRLYELLFVPLVPSE
jgi:AcrR family transcriptional regulator